MKRVIGIALAIGCLLALAAPGPASAIRPDEILDDPVLEARARAISGQLRCVVCQNQSIDDSNAEIARDMRLIVRERLIAGDSDAAAIGYLVARYGDYVLLDPPFKATTLPLWLGPPFLILLVLAIVFMRTRARFAAAKTEPGEAALSATERKTLEAMLATVEAADTADADSDGGK